MQNLTLAQRKKIQNKEIKDKQVQEEANMANVADPEAEAAAGGMVLSERAASENNNADDSLSEADDNPVVEHQNNYGDDSSSAIGESVDSVQGEDKVDEAQPPLKPGMLNWTKEDIHNEIRRKIKYDPGNLYQDDEIDEKGMMEKLGLKTQLETIEIIEKRKKDADYQFRMVNFQITNARKKYEKDLAEYRILHPEKYQPTVLEKRKKPTPAAQGQKQPRTDYEEYNELDDEHDEDIDDKDSDYKNDRQKSGKRKGGNDLENFQQNLDNDSDDQDELRRPLSSKKRQSTKQYDHQQNDEEAKQEQKMQKDRQDLLEAKRAEETNYEQLRPVVLKRAKLEKWTDEPFFDKTVTNAFVRILGPNKRYVIAQIAEVEEDESKLYKLSNNKKTSKYLKLNLFDGNTYKLMKIDQVSNSEMQYQEFLKLADQRVKHKIPPINNETVLLLQEAYDRARNYKYDDKLNEREKMAEKNFYRCLRSNELKNFSNVHYFQHKLEIRKSDLEQQIESKLFRQENLDSIYQAKMDQSKATDEDVGNRKLIALKEKEKQDIKMALITLKKDLKEITEDLEKVYQHNRQSLRMTKTRSTGTGSEKQKAIDEIVQLEDEKVYNQWLEKQRKAAIQEQVKKLNAQGQESTQDEKLLNNLKLDDEIKKIIEMHKHNSRSNFELFKGQKDCIEQVHRPQNFEGLAAQIKAKLKNPGVKEISVQKAHPNL